MAVCDVAWRSLWQSRMEFSRPYRVKISRRVKACSLAENRPADIFLQLNWCQGNVKNILARGNSERGFLCQILSTCLRNRISIANWSAAKAKTDDYLKPSFVWNIQTMHSICFCRVPFTNLISRHFYLVFGVLDSVSRLQRTENHNLSYPFDANAP